MYIYYTIALHAHVPEEWRQDKALREKRWCFCLAFRWRNAALKCLISRQYAENIQEERQRRICEPSVNKTFGKVETEKCHHWLDDE